MSGFSISVLAYFLFFGWIGLFATFLFLDHGLPTSAAPGAAAPGAAAPGAAAPGAYKDRFFYDFMVLSIRAEVVWIALAAICLSVSVLWSVHLHHESHPASLGDGIPVVIHLVLIVIFGFLCYVTSLFMIFLAWQ